MSAQNPASRRLFASINVLVVWYAAFSLSTAEAEGTSRYVDDCQHWLEIATATVALRTKGDEKLEQVIGYVDQYLINSQIASERKKQILDRIRQVWIEGLMFGHDLEYHLMDKCDVK